MSTQTNEKTENTATSAGCFASRPQAEHEWLQKLVGEWSYEGSCAPEPGQPEMKFSGTETVRSIGGLWVLAEGRGEMPGGGEAVSLLTIGFDPVRGKYVGTWVGSMLAHLFVYEGNMDSTGRVLSLDCEGPVAPGSSQIGKFRDIVEIRNDNERIFTGNRLGEDGRMEELMRIVYRRKA